MIGTYKGIEIYKDEEGFYFKNGERITREKYKDLLNLLEQYDEYKINTNTNTEQLIYLS